MFKDNVCIALLSPILRVSLAENKSQIASLNPVYILSGTKWLKRFFFRLTNNRRFFHLDRAFVGSFKIYQKGKKYLSNCQVDSRSYVVPL